MRKFLIASLLFVALSGSVFAQTAVGTSLNAATTTGAGTGFSVNQMIHWYTWTVTFTTAAPTSQTTNLEGSLDNVHWFTLDTSTSVSYTSATYNGEMRHVVYKPVLYLRCNLTTYTQGSNAGVTCNILRVRTN